jgi:hypothetical protein
MLWSCFHQATKNTFPRQRLGNHGPTATAQQTCSRGYGSVNTFPLQRLSKHVPAATAW